MGRSPGSRSTVPLRCTRAPSLKTVTAAIGASRPVLSTIGPPLPLFPSSPLPAAGSADAAVAVDVGTDGPRRGERDEHMRAARDDVPYDGDQHIAAPGEPEGVIAVGARAGARDHPGGQRPGLDPDVPQTAGRANAVLPRDRAPRAGLDDAKDERG